MDDTPGSEEEARRELFGARATLGYWERYNAELVAGKLLWGSDPSPDQMEKIRTNVEYWTQKIRRLEEWLNERPEGWGSW